MPSCVIFNPTARGDKARHFRAQLASLAPDCALKPTDTPGAAQRLAAEALTEGFDTIIAAGGDGTVNEVVTGLLRHPESLRRVRLGILPLGTINVVARELGIPLSLPRAWAIANGNAERTIDLAEIEFAGPAGPQRRPIIQLADAGLDARAVELVNWSLKKKFGPLAYLWAGVKAFCEPQSEITITTGGTSHTAAFVLLGNGRYYGGSLRVFPQARLDDGQFDLCLVERVSWPALFRFAWGIATSRLEHQPGYLHLQSNEFTLTSTARVPLEIEGDAVGHLPATCRVLPRALRILVP